MTVVAAKWTIEEYHRMVAAGILCDRAVELLKGEIIEMPPEREPHAYCSDEAGEYLTRLLGDRESKKEHSCRYCSFGAERSLINFSSHQI